MEHINELDQQDLEDYKELMEQRTHAEMCVISYQKYIEDKYLAGLDLEEGSVYVDWVNGVIYYWS